MQRIIRVMENDWNAHTNGYPILQLRWIKYLYRIELVNWNLMTIVFFNSLGIAAGDGFTFNFKEIDQASKFMKRDFP